MKNSLFLSDVTVLDCAIASGDRRAPIRGASYNLGFHISGEVDEHEQVVVDFSQIKKQIKAIIDHKEWGLDHKFLIQSDASYVGGPENSEYIDLFINDFDLLVPSNSVNFINSSLHGQFIGKFVQDKLKSEYGLDCTVECFMDEEMKTPYSIVDVFKNKFRSVHGLPKSSSWGCQNICHGHNSFALALRKGDVQIPAASHIISDYYSNAFIYAKEFVTEYSEVYEIEYTTERGTFCMRIPKDKKVILLEKEPTIENMVEHVIKENYSGLLGLGVDKVFISEGLKKGSYMNMADFK